MSADGLNRRDFHKLSAAALGGMIAGAVIGCGDGGSTSGNKASNSSSPNAPKGTETANTALSDSAKADSPKSGTKEVVAVAATVGMHACRGLNECKQQGKDKKNSCAGQGNCYTVAKHDCGGQNECKYQGGCGGKDGINECKGQGGCGHLPIAGGAWKKAREAFEGRMAKAGKKVGPAPEPVKG
jgi:hypothetical protein